MNASTKKSVLHVAIDSLDLREYVKLVSDDSDPECGERNAERRRYQHPIL
jgi:hypothetical protein